MNDFRAHRVHDIAYQGDARSDGDGLINERQIIADSVLSRCFAGSFHANDIVTTLGKAHEKRDEEGHEHYPFAQWNVSCKAAGKQTEHKTEGHDAHINNGILLQTGAIG